MESLCAVYIMTNKNKSVLYTGVTSDLLKRIHDHKMRINPKSFTARYNIDKLVYFEMVASISDAIQREKQIKAGPRKKKIELINSINPIWNDLSQDLTQTDN